MKVQSPYNFFGSENASYCTPSDSSLFPFDELERILSNPFESFEWENQTTTPTTNNNNNTTNNNNNNNASLDIEFKIESPNSTMSPLEEILTGNNALSDSELQTPSPPSTMAIVEQRPRNAALEARLARFEPYKKKQRRRGEQPISVDKSRVAKQRMRDANGKFLKKDVSSKIEELENRLKERSVECDSLKMQLLEKTHEVEYLRNQLIDTQMMMVMRTNNNISNNNGNHQHYNTSSGINNNNNNLTFSHPQLPMMMMLNQTTPRECLY